MRHNKNTRLKPSLLSTRYVHLTKLRNQTLNEIKAITSENEVKILVDFGCGDMPYRSIIEPLVGKYLGVDLEMNHLAEHHIGFDSKTSLPNSYCDIILSNQVLEHVDSPQGYLEEAYRILKPGGTAIITTHGYWFYHPTPNDYWRWTSAGLKKTVQEANFTINSFFGIMGLAASGIQLFQDAIINKLPKFMVPPIAFFFQLCIRLFDKIHTQEQRNRDASLYIVVAQKPF
ncbi:MAG: SAM-dependent methyltransferase [Sphingobacteriales bacterium]|nr:MAG: SAM-dependent methyltransferase [Sphingobacteriales bacterium]TAF83153.1 MAG: SAM-dependent methyltransferase [Sphingobacteriales bacterium]